jgi:hypothetical protein
MLPWAGLVTGDTLGRVSDPVLRVRVMKESQVAELSVTRAGAAHEKTLTSSVLMFFQGKTVVYASIFVLINNIGFILHIHKSYSLKKSSLIVNISLTKVQKYCSWYFICSTCPVLVPARRRPMTSTPKSKKGEKRSN